MKKTILFMSMVAAFLFAGCQKEQSAKTLTLTASIEQQQEANKTSLNGGYVLWSKDDAINVFTDDPDNNNYQFKLKSGAGSTQASFSSVGEVSGNPTYAIYPYAAGNTISGSTITFNLPATQKYVENSFDNGANVAVAQVTSSGMKFMNVCGVLKLQIKGNMTIKRIELSGKNNEKLNGKFTVNVMANPFIGAEKYGDPVDSEKSITLDCGNNGIELDADKYVSFYFVVPVSAFAGGFKAKFVDIYDDTIIQELSTSNLSECTINRSQVRVMPERVVCYPIPDGYSTLSFIQSQTGGAGVQYINTKYVVDSDDVLQAKIIYLKDQYYALPTIFGSEQALTGRYAIRWHTDGFYFMSASWYFITKTIDYSSPFMVVADFIRKRAYFGSQSKNIDIDSFPTSPLYLFNLYYDGHGGPASDGFCSMKLFTFRIFSNGKLIKNFVPVIRDIDDVVGICETMSGDFLTNAGSGSFIAGPELTD